MSLIEILVVISMIAILLGICLPLLRQSRELANRCKCAHNMMSLSRAFTLYVDDWNGIYPAPGGLVGNWGYWSQSGLGGLAHYVGPSRKSLATVWCCPELPEWTGQYPPRSYAMNSYLRDPKDVDYPTCTGIKDGIRACDILRPRRTILLYEGLPELAGNHIDYVYRCANWAWVRGWFPKPAPSYYQANIPWHGRFNNYLYCDGHLRARKPECYSDTPSHFPPLDEHNEWYVDPIAVAKRVGKG
jgi:prepilin-type processing-associated H-X9-DG protein